MSSELCPDNVTEIERLTLHACILRFEQSVVSGQCDRNRVSEFLSPRRREGLFGTGASGERGVEE